MQNRLVLTGIPEVVPTLEQSLESIRDIVEEQSCWVDRMAFLMDGSCIVELHLENVRDDGIRSLNNTNICLNATNGSRITCNNYSKCYCCCCFTIQSFPATMQQSQQLLQQCPTPFNDNDEDDTTTTPLIQTVSFPSSSSVMELTITRSPTGGGTGAEAWRGGYLLASQLLLQPSSSLLDTRMLFHNKDVLELGAGCAGLPSMVLARMMSVVKPKSIVATDGVDEIVSQLQQTIDKNQLQTQIQVQHLDWNSSSLKKQQQCHYDTILFADCVYTEKGARLLFNAIRTLLRPGGTVLGVLPDFRVGLDIFYQQMNHQFQPTTLPLLHNHQHKSNFIGAGNNGKHYQMICWRDKTTTTHPSTTSFNSNVKK